MEQRKKIADSIVYIVLTVLAVAFLVPIFLVIMNSLKNKLYISTTPFVLPNEAFAKAAKAADPTWKAGKPIPEGALDGITREYVESGKKSVDIKI